MIDRGETCSRRAFLALLAGGTAAAGFPGCLLEGGGGGSGPVRFGVLADVQFADQEPRGSRYYRESAAKLAVCVDALNREDLDFVIHLGDFIDRDFESFDVLMPIWEQLKAPAYSVLGNHDFDVAQELRAKVPARLGMKTRYYDFAIRGWRFIALDGNDVSLYARREGSPKHARAQAVLDALKERGARNAHAWNGAIGDEQLAWLRERLDGAAEAGERVVLFCHFPVFPANKHNLLNDTAVVALLEQYPCVFAWINGHNHAGHYGRKEGIHYVTVQGMVETADSTAWATVAARPAQLFVDGRGREEDRLLGGGP